MTFLDAAAPRIRPRRHASAKRAIVVPASRIGHRSGWGIAFAQGLARHGWEVELSPSPRTCDLLVLWGVRRREAIAAQRASGGAVCILERGYVGDRFAWTSVSFGGGLNGRGRFHGPVEDRSRWEAHFALLMQPWRRAADGYALILGQVPGDMSLAGIDAVGLWTEAARQLRESGHEVVFRAHPQRPDLAVPRTRTLARTVPLEDALAGAAHAITINSNSGVDAVLAGVPTVVLDDRSMAWPVAGHDVAAPPPMPDRDAWATALAWKQWRHAEFMSGACWDVVGEGASSEACAPV